MKTSVSTIRRHAFMATTLAMGVLTVSGCAMHSSAVALRAPTDTPDHFLVGAISGGETWEPGGDLVCHSPLVDPRTGAKITLVRSSGGRGDYEVPEGRYGVGEKEVLRIECANGKALGIFKR
jgi:hypothetical protein